jgi:cell division transport system ATP-binding protein
VVVNPQILLADEPTGNLDPDLSFRLMDLFMQFHAHGTTVILATHSRDLIARNPSAKILRLEDGKITYANWTGATLFRSADQSDFEPSPQLHKGVSAL